MLVIEQPIPPVTAADSATNVLAEWNAIYDAYNEVACLMLGSMTLELHRQFKNYSPYEMLQELKSMFEKQDGMKGYVDQLERLGYVLPQDLTVGLILNGLTKDFAGFVINYNMHNMGKTIGKLSAMLIEYKKGLPKKAETPQVMMIKYGKIQKSKKKSLKAKDKGKANGKGNDKQVYIPKPKGIEKLQQEGLLKSTDDESFDQCVSCLSGKMTRKSFPHRPERATDLLGIIHTDVFGPLRHVSRQGASYFITFTDDYSRYGYVYLLKHKHEVFETFKVFKNEVENQLGKTINALRSNRGGEYISEEFKDYLEACGIIQQLTPPYTPQHNGVSERRNRTLLDMVRSMMNLTTLPLSFWDYALESATRILNMV
ncbi:retrotransposon protein, putative, ty1-copia subclass [Tanacetum coccineum]